MWLRLKPKEPSGSQVGAGAVTIEQIVTANLDSAYNLARWLVKDPVLAEDVVRPTIFYTRGGVRRQPYVRDLTTMVNSIYNGWRLEDVWLDR